MKKINLNQYNRKSNLRIRKFNNEYYMLCSEKCYKINEIGAIIVKYIGRDTTIDDLSNSIMKLYKGCNEDEIIDDIKDFINFLLNDELISLNG